MKPVIVVQQGNISDEAIQELRDIGVVVVVAKTPGEVWVRDLSTNKQSEIALQLVRHIIKQKGDAMFAAHDIAQSFAKMLLKESE